MGATLKANDTLKEMAQKLQVGTSCKGNQGASNWQSGRPVMPARVQDLSQITQEDLSKMHDALDLAGIATPAADVLNAGLYLMEGDFKNAVISAVAVVPGAGDAVAFGRVAYKSGKYVDDLKFFTKAAGKDAKVSIRPTWRQSEIDAAKMFPDYEEQVSFIGNERVPYSTKGSVRPDLYKEGSSIEVKNYAIESSSRRNNLAWTIEQQYKYRLDKLPTGTQQMVLIDTRGQTVSEEQLRSLQNNIMKRTNNGIEVGFMRE